MLYLKAIYTMASEINRKNTEKICHEKDLKR